jgi:hypothetical protein
MLRTLTASLRGRLLLAFLAPAVVFFTFLGVLAVTAARSTLEEEVGARLMDTATATAALLPGGVIARFSPGNERTSASLQLKLATVRDSVGARRVFLATLDGRSLVDSEPQGAVAGEPDRALMQDRFELARVADGRSVSTVLFEGADGLRYLRGYAPVWDDDEGTRRIVAVVGVEGSARSYAGIDALGAYMTSIIAAALLAVGATVIFTSRALTAPLAPPGRGRAGASAPADSTTASRSRAAPRRSARWPAPWRRCGVALLARERELQMMLGGIAHEVRNPLGGMELFVGLLREDLSESPEQLALLGRVERELGNLKRVVEGFLDFARQVPLETSPVALADLVIETSMLGRWSARLVPGRPRRAHPGRPAAARSPAAEPDAKCASGWSNDSGGSRTPTGTCS